MQEQAKIERLQNYLDMRRNGLIKTRDKFTKKGQITHDKFNAKIDILEEVIQYVDSIAEAK